jgi:hypothetical protein
MKKAMFLKGFIVMLLLSPFYVSATVMTQPCDSVQVKVFGIVVLEKWYGDCDPANLPDGNWDWWP